MDRVLSARVDESIVHLLTLLARQLGTSKKAVIERAIALLAEQLDAERRVDVFASTCGAWSRDETPEETVSRGRAAFRASMERHHR